MKNATTKAPTNKSNRTRLVVDSAEELNAGRIAISIGGWTFGQVSCEGGTVWGATDGHTVYTL